ncbi:hypothetical protein AC1031_006388 [Aphanomyces cochlioides]|nr:hypothetical protein AC1031_006388 [Aphanomyces cochlioides]
MADNVRSPLQSPRVAAASSGHDLEGWSLTKEMNWPASRGSVTALLPDLVAMNLELASCTVTSGHVALCFAYADTVSNYSLVVVLDAIPEQKFDQAFQLDLIKELCKPSSTDLRSQEQRFRASNTDMLLSRHESRVIDIAFLRADKTLSSKAKPLRCLVVCEDGMGYLWEWHPYVWTFLNQAEITSESRLTHAQVSSSFSGQYTFAWRQQQPAPDTLHMRHLTFELEASLARHPTSIGLGHLMTTSLPGLHWMRDSRLGLWLVTAEEIHLQSFTTPMALRIQHPCPQTSQPLVLSVHATTGALAMFDLSSKMLWLCVKQDGALNLSSLPISSSTRLDGTVDMACHDHFVFLLRHDQRCDVYDIHTGAHLTSIETVVGDRGRFWTCTTGIGISSWHGVWRFTLPSAKQYSAHIAATHGSDFAAQCLASYGPNMRFDHTLRSFESLRTHRGPWPFDALTTVQKQTENPALLLSVVDPSQSKVPSPLLQDLEALVKALHDQQVMTKSTTPLNLDSLEHLTSYVRLQSFRASCLTDDKSKTSNVADKVTPGHHEALSRQRLLHESSLRWASLISSKAYGPALLSTLQAQLSIDFKSVPSHVLFHEERRTALDSIRHPLYFESLARLYFDQTPARFHAFVESIASFCPRLFTLDGVVRIVRSHANRALLALPPLQLASKYSQDNNAVMEMVVTAYVDGLLASKAYVEALYVLLRFRQVDKAIELMKERVPAQVKPTWFQALLQYVVQHESTNLPLLERVLALKPSHIGATQVLLALREAMPASLHVQVGAWRQILALIVS